MSAIVCPILDTVNDAEEQQVPKISIIIPIYNVELQLTNCLESIRKQSLRDFECVLVDDGSTDRSAEIADEFCKRDGRFIVIHQKNAGVGTARNAGLKVATGTYITFVDSDDTIGETFLEGLCYYAKNQDIVVSGFTMCRGTAEKTIGTVKGMPTTDQLAVAMRQGLLNSCWGKLYRREVIKEILFSETLFWGEDTDYLLRCLCKTRKIYFCQLHGYFYTYSTTGLANRFDKRKPDYLRCYYKTLISFLDNWATPGDVLYNETCIKVSQEMIRTIDALIEHPLAHKEEGVYLRTLFSNSEINQLFSYGIKRDNNPPIIKLLATWPRPMRWLAYIKLRRIYKGWRK